MNLKNKAIATVIMMMFSVIACEPTSVNDTTSAATSVNDQTKGASRFTLQKNEALKKELDFDNQADFDAASKGFIASWPEKTIKDPDGKVTWDFGKYEFLKGSKDIDTINPSLLRQARLNNHHGLFEVAEGVYQVRGFDLANDWLYATRLTVAAMAVGRARRAMDLVLPYTVERKQFGQSIGKFQGVSFKLADMITEIDAADLLTLSAAWRFR